MPNFVLVKTASVAGSDFELCVTFLKTQFKAVVSFFTEANPASSDFNREKGVLKTADAVFLLMPANVDLHYGIDKIEAMRRSGLLPQIPIFIVLQNAQSDKVVDTFIANQLIQQNAKIGEKSIALYQSKPKVSTQKKDVKTKKIVVPSAAASSIWIHGVWGLQKGGNSAVLCPTLEEILERKGTVKTVTPKSEASLSRASAKTTEQPQSSDKKPLETNKDRGSDSPVTDSDSEDHSDDKNDSGKKVPASPGVGTSPTAVGSSTSDEKKSEQTIEVILPTSPNNLAVNVPPLTQVSAYSAVSTAGSGVPGSSTAEIKKIPVMLSIVSPSRNWNIWIAVLCGLGGTLLTCIVLYVLQSLAVLQVMAFISELIAGTVLVALPPLGVLLLGLACVGVLVAFVAFPIINRKIIAAKWRGEVVNTWEDKPVVGPIMDKDILSLTKENSKIGPSIHQKGVFAGEGYVEQLRLEGEEEEGFYFNRYHVLGDGDCGYTAFGITREKAYELLTRHAVTNRDTGVGIFLGEEAEAAVAEQLVVMLKPVIEEALLTGAFIDYLETKDAVALEWRGQKSANLSARDSNELETSSSRQSGSQTHSSEEEDVGQDIMAVKLNDFNQVKRDFDQYKAVSDKRGNRIDREVSSLKAHAANSAVILAYLNYDIRDKRIDDGWAHPCVLQALAHIRGINLFRNYSALFF